MKHFLLVFLTVILSVSTCQRKGGQIPVNELTMVEYADTLSPVQLDSLFIADSLSFDLENDWILSTSVAESKQDLFYKYVYIRDLTDSTGTVYTLCTYEDTLYIINKRVVK